MLSKKIDALVRHSISFSKKIFLPVALVMMAFFIFESRGSLGKMFKSADVGFLTGAILVWMVVNVTGPLVTQGLLMALEFDIKFQQVMRIHCARLPAKYLPGGVWHTVAKSADFNAMGASKDKVIRLFILENITVLLMAVIVGGGLLIKGGSKLHDFISCIVAVAVLAVVFTPYIVKFWFPSVEKTNIRLRYYYRSIVIMGLHWCLAATAFSLYLFSYPEFRGIWPLMDVAGTYLLSWAMGYVAIFAPQGIGVSELVASYLLAGGKFVGELIALLATFRLIVLAGDILVWAVLGIFRLKH